MTRTEDYSRSSQTAAALGLEIDLMRPLSPFALRTPFEVKEAARALASCGFYEWAVDGNGDERTVASWGGGSINDTLNQLLKQGLLHCRPLILSEISRLKSERLPFARLAAHLISEPDAGGVRASDFPNDEEVRVLLEKGHKDWGHEDDKWTWSRADIMLQMSHFDRHLQELNAALSAVTLALETKAK